MSVFARACERIAVLETLNDWHSANSGDRSNKSGDFQDQTKEHSSGYRGGVKIDLEFTFTAQILFVAFLLWQM